jgi:hypothetical protein
MAALSAASPLREELTHDGTAGVGFVGTAADHAG